MSEDLTPVDAQPKPAKVKSKDSLITRFRNWLLDSYNGLFKIVIQPQLPSLRVLIFCTIAFVLGLIWAYSVAPVKFYNAAPHQLSSGARDQWVKFVANSYPDSYGEETTIRLLREIEDPVGTIDRLIASDTSAQPEQVTINLQNIRPLAEQAQPGTDAPSGGSIIASILGFIFAVLAYIIIVNVFALLYGLLIGGFVIQITSRIRKMIYGETEADKRSRAAIEGIKARKVLEQKMREESAQESQTSSFGPPLTQRMSPYQKGRAYDDSFAIEDANDMFLGECGATIKKTIGDNELSAIEIWLFDKEDFVRTLTKYFVSEHAYNDPVTRSELESEINSPDDIIIANKGSEIIIETDQIRMRARVIDITYGTDPSLPPNSYFESINLQMEAWEKTGVSKSVPAAVPVPAASGLPSLDSYEIGPPPTMPSATPPPTSAASGLPSLDSYEIGPPPTMPSGTTQAPPPSFPPPPQDEDDDPFGGTGDFTPIGR